MAAPLRLYVDIQLRKLVISNTVSGEAPTIILRQGETIPIQLYFLDSTGGSAVSNPYPAYYNPADLGIKMGICADQPTGGTDVLLAYEEDGWTPITNGYSASLNCNTTEMGDALADRASRDATLEIEITDSGGSPVKIIQVPITIQSGVIDENSIDPATLSEALTKTEAAASYVKIIGQPGARIILPNEAGDKAIEIKCAADGTPIIATIDPYVP